MLSFTVFKDLREWTTATGRASAQGAGWMVGALPTGLALGEGWKSAPRA